MKRRASGFLLLSMCISLICGCERKEAPETVVKAPDTAVAVPETEADAMPPEAETSTLPQTIATAPETDEPVPMRVARIPPPAEAVDIRIEDNGAGVEGVVAEFVVRGSVERVFRIVSDTGNIDRIFPSIRKAELLEELPSDNQRLSQGIWKYTLKTPIDFLGDRSVDVRVIYDSDKMTVRWQRVRGDFSALEGEWSLKVVSENPQYTRIVYKSFIDGGRLIPQIITNELNRQDAESMAALLRANLAGSG